MKIIRLFGVAAAALFYCSAVLAQTSGTVTNHAFAIGKGAGQTGFTSLLCAATELAVGQTSANPACKSLSGDVTMDADGVTAIGANKVLDTMLRHSGALSVIGRSANSSGNVADISAVAGSGCAFREASNVIGCGELATAALGVNIVTNAKLAQMANGTTKCRTTSGTGNVEDCTASQMRSLLSLVVGTNVQAWDADLDCYAALSGTGIIRRTGSGTCSNGTAVANSELATMADGTIKGNVSGGSAAPSNITPTQALDVIGATRGSILYRGASGWAIAAPATAGQVWTSNGTGADPTYQDAAGGGGASDTDRRNALLILVYQSKVYALSGIGSYRRVINTFADGLITLDGINTGASSNYQQDPILGVIEPTLGAGSNVSTSSTAIAAAALSGTAGQTADGTLSGSNGWISNATGSGVNGVSYVGQNFGSGNAKHIRQMVLYQGINGNATYSVSSAKIQYSDDGSSWTDHSTVSVSGTLSPQTFPMAASAAHQYWRLLANSTAGAANRWAVTELQMTENTGSSDDMVLETTAQTADSSVSNARVLIEFDNTDSPALNTDLTVEVTCNGGTNWAAATLSAVTSYSQGGRKVVETSDTACTSGTSFAARIKSFNGKSVPLYGMAITVH